MGDQLFGGRSFSAEGLAQPARGARVALAHAVVELDGERCGHDRNFLGKVEMTEGEPLPAGERQSLPHRFGRRPGGMTDGELGAHPLPRPRHLRERRLDGGARGRSRQTREVLGNLQRELRLPEMIVKLTARGGMDAHGLAPAIAGRGV